MIKFFKDNFVEGANLSASTENAQFPLVNLQDDRRSKVYRSTGSSATVVFDLQTTEDIDSIILAPNKIDGFNLLSPITIEANATDSWGSPAYSTTLSSIDDVHGIAYKLLSAPESYRFWRLSLSGTSYVELAYVYIGKVTELDNNRSISFGWGYQEDDLKNESENVYGQKFVDEIIQRKKIQFKLNALDKDNMDKIFKVYDERRTTKPFCLFIGDDNMINNSNRFKLVCYMNNKPRITNNFYAHYYLSINVEEAL